MNKKIKLFLYSVITLSFSMNVLSMAAQEMKNNFRKHLSNEIIANFGKKSIEFSSIEGESFGTDAKYFYISIGGKLLYAIGDKVEMKAKEDFLVEDGYKDDGYLWAFATLEDKNSKGEDKMFKILNKSAGAGKSLACVAPEMFPELTPEESVFYYDSRLGAIYTIYSSKKEYKMYIRSNGDFCNRSFFDVSCLFKAKPAVEIANLVERWDRWEAICKKSAETLPFKFTTNLADAEWYLIKAVYDNSYLVVYRDFEPIPSIHENLPKYLWAFVKGDTEGTFFIYNKSLQGKPLTDNQYYYSENGRINTAIENFVDPQIFTFTNRDISFIPYSAETKKAIDEAIDQKIANGMNQMMESKNKLLQERQQAIQAKKQAYNQMIATVGKANYDMLMANKMPKGISLKQLDAYAKYVNHYFEYTEHAIRFKQITDSSWDITLVRNNNAVKSEDRVCYFNNYRIYLVNGRVSSYRVLY